MLDIGAGIISDIIISFRDDSKYISHTYRNHKNFFFCTEMSIVRLSFREQDEADENIGLIFLSRVLDIKTLRQTLFSDFSEPA